MTFLSLNARKVYILSNVFCSSFGMCDHVDKQLLSFFTMLSDRHKSCGQVGVELPIFQTKVARDGLHHLWQH